VREALQGLVLEDMFVSFTQRPQTPAPVPEAADLLHQALESQAQPFATSAADRYRACGQIPVDSVPGMRPWIELCAARLAIVAAGEAALRERIRQRPPGPPLPRRSYGDGMGEPRPELLGGGRRPRQPQ
jgi:hypothetical protein